MMTCGDYGKVRFKIIYWRLWNKQDFNCEDGGSISPKFW
jgi:hypothetical protein